MSETFAVLKTAAKPEQLKAQNAVARSMVQNDIGVRVEDLDAKDFTKLTQAMAATKKPAEWVVSFDGEWVSYFVRVGSKPADKIDITSVRISEEKDVAKRNKILAALLAKKAATQAQVDAFNQAHPDPDALAALKKQIDDLNGRIKGIQVLIGQFKGTTFENASPAFFGGLQRWTDKHSQSHYIDFLSDIQAGADAQGIYDKYIKPGASYPVNLTDGTRLAIENELKAGKKPNFAHARAEILHVVDGKIIPQYISETTASLHKQMAEDQKQVAALQHKYTAMGGK